jgi:hypothetical protein
LTQLDDDIFTVTGDILYVVAPAGAWGKVEQSALRKQLERWAGLSELRRIVVSHGAPIERDPDRALRSLAASLARS